MFVFFAFSYKTQFNQLFDQCYWNPRLIGNQFDVLNGDALTPKHILGEINMDHVLSLFVGQDE